MAAGRTVCNCVEDKGNIFVAYRTHGGPVQVALRDDNVTYRVVMSAEALTEYLDSVFPEMHARGRVFSIASVEPGRAVVEATTGEQHLRPGGTVSGPTLFTLADFAAYAVILAHIGPQALAVTTNLTINFLSRAAPGVLEGRCRLLKLGKRLAVVECDIVHKGTGDLIAHASATYSIPPAR